MVNLSIQTVQDEIQSLRDKAREMEVALDQRRLEMDNEAKKLNVELTKSDDEAAAALQEAERMAKLRLQKTKELHELKQQLKLQAAASRSQRKGQIAQPSKSPHSETNPPYYGVRERSCRFDHRIPKATQPQNPQNQAFKK